MLVKAKREGRGLRKAAGAGGFFALTRSVTRELFSLLEECAGGLAGQAILPDLELNLLEV
jgi:hypothetical protein